MRTDNNQSVANAYAPIEDAEVDGKWMDFYDKSEKSCEGIEDYYENTAEKESLYDEEMMYPNCTDKRYIVST